MKLRLTFRSASEGTKRKVIKVDAFTLMSLLKDEAIAEIAEQVYTKGYEKSGFYLCAISDIG